MYYYIAYNRAFGTFEEARAYCLACDFDPDFAVGGLGLCKNLKK